MKTFRNYIVFAGIVFIALIFSFAFVGCGGDENDDKRKIDDTDVQETINNYTVTFDVQNATTQIPAPEPITAPFNTVITLPTPTEIDNYTFIGWHKLDGNQIGYADGGNLRLPKIL